MLSPVEPFSHADAITADPLNLESLGNLCIFAPHPDDESLGCGGLIASACRSAARVHIVIVSDGSRSHPNSMRFPPERMRHIRRQEAINAIEALGVTSHETTFLTYLDGSVPDASSPTFSPFVDVVSACIAGSEATTVFAPHAGDPHCDHRAVHAAVHAARERCFPHVRVLEYPIWVPAHADSRQDVSRRERTWRLDIHEVLERKKAAIRCHVSQTGNMIDDDPTGFRLSDEMLAQFEGSTECYFEAMR